MCSSWASAKGLPKVRMIEEMSGAFFRRDEGIFFFRFAAGRHETTGFDFIKGG